MLHIILKKVNSFQVNECYELKKNYLSYTYIYIIFNKKRQRNSLKYIRICFENFNISLLEYDT